MSTTTTTAHKVGDLVRATVTAQGLRAGATYEVEAVYVNDLPFGRFVTYYVRDDVDSYAVGNGHLVLAAVTA